MREHAHLLLGWILVGCAVPALVEERLFRRLGRPAHKDDDDQDDDD